MKPMYELQSELEGLKYELTEVTTLMNLAIDKGYDFTQLFRTVNDLKYQIEKKSVEMKGCGGTKDPLSMTTNQAILSTASVRRKIPAELSVKIQSPGTYGTIN